MPRVKIKFPDQKPIFSTTIAVRITDINYGGHLGNDSVLSLLHEVRMQMLSSWGYTEMQVGGAGLIMADVMIAYKAEAFYGDILQVDIYAEEISERTFDLLYHASCAGKDIAHAKTGMVCFDYTARKIAQIPADLKNKLQAVVN